MTRVEFVDSVFENLLEEDGKELLRIIVEEREKSSTSDKEINKKVLQKLISKLKQKR